MDEANLIRQELHMQGFPAYETDIPFIKSTLNTMKKAQSSLQAFPYINMEVPITVVDQRAIR